MIGGKRTGRCLLLFALLILAAGEFVRYAVAIAAGKAPTLLNLGLIVVGFIAVVAHPLVLKLVRRKPARPTASAARISEVAQSDSADQPVPDAPTIPVLTPEIHQSRISDLYSMAKEG